MQNFELKSLLDRVSSQEKSYLEFLRIPSMSMGLYQLTAGSTDLQKPHEQDEVYYVLDGRAKLRVKNKIIPAIPGSILFIEAGTEHKFIEIEKDLNLLVFFAPAETS